MMILRKQEIRQSIILIVQWLYYVKQRRTIYRISYVYNDLDQITEVKYNGSTRFVYHYTGDGQLYQVEDEALGLTHTYTYDALGRLIYSSTEEIADFYCATNELHPFREGNGRTQHVFLTKLIESAGYTINLAEMDTDLLMIATIYAAQGVTDLLKRTLPDNIHPKK